MDVDVVVIGAGVAARSNGCALAYKHRLLGVEPNAGGYELSPEGPTGDLERIETAHAVNAAGLHADSVAALAGIDVDAAGYRQTYVKGNYFRISKRGLVRHLIYPVPPAGLVGLGLHVTLDLAGAAGMGQPRRDRVPGA